MTDESPLFDAVVADHFAPALTQAERDLDALETQVAGLIRELEEERRISGALRVENMALKAGGGWRVYHARDDVTRWFAQHPTSGEWVGPFDCEGDALDAARLKGERE